MERRFPQEEVTRGAKSLLTFLGFLEKSGWEKEIRPDAEQQHTGLGGEMLMKATKTLAITWAESHTIPARTSAKQPKKDLRI